MIIRGLIRDPGLYVGWAEISVHGLVRLQLKRGALGVMSKRAVVISW